MNNTGTSHLAQTSSFYGDLLPQAPHSGIMIDPASDGRGVLTTFEDNVSRHCSPTNCCVFACSELTGATGCQSPSSCTTSARALRMLVVFMPAGAGPTEEM